ncbi:probable sugar phosphate/phosphate translocator At1g53660 [Asparagus officinalis]|uniref:probable sugar phosphate/phosphate translocator At1g53660 n=1 Tax=Asparagus officinalis TaxID=4686 RepID=UPI00098E4407|nr:probable sugar phosphate/phosphate translocator At1g53660 [Asparagus officinalis]
MAFSSALCLITLKVMKARGIEHPGNRNFKETKQNRNVQQSYMEINLHFEVRYDERQKRAKVHIAVAVLENVFENGATQYKMLLSTITLGVIVASYGEVSSSWRGVGYQMGSVICEALRLIVIQYTFNSNSSIIKKGVFNKICRLLLQLNFLPCSMDVLGEADD